MREQKLDQKIKTYIRDGYFEPLQTDYQLFEQTESGRTQLNISLSSEGEDVLCISNYDDKPRCAYFSDKNGMKKCVDHVILIKQKEGDWKASLIEMKSTVGNSAWAGIKQKVRASILNINALATVLDIRIQSIDVYTTYESTNFHYSEPENPIARKLPLGSSGIKKEEWDNNIIKIDFLEDNHTVLPHAGVQMIRQEIEGKSVLCGSLVI